MLRAVKVASAHLVSGYYQLARHTKGQAVEVFVNDILLHIAEQLSDRHAAVERVHRIVVSKYSTFGGAVGIIELVCLGRLNRHQLFAAHRKIFRVFGVGENLGVLSAHLGGHKGVGYAVLSKIFPDRHKVKAYALVDDMELTAACQHRIHVHHVSVKAVAGIG